MKQEELLKSLIMELFKMDEMHQEYQDNDTHILVDTQKKGNELTIKVILKENKDKKNFEKWVKTLPDELFNEIWEALSAEDELHSLDELYNSPNYKEVIEKFKNKSKEIANRKIKELQKLISQ